MKKEILLLAIKDPNIISVKAKVRNNESFLFFKFKKNIKPIKEKINTFCR